MKLSKEEFCDEYGLTEDQFYGRDIIEEDLGIIHSKYLPEGCSLGAYKSLRFYELLELPKVCFLKSEDTLSLPILKKLSEGCTLKAIYIDLESLKELPENYSVDAVWVWCKNVIPTYKGSSEFYLGEWNKKKSFKDFSYIKEEPLKFLRSDEPLEKALAEYFLKNP